MAPPAKEAEAWGVGKVLALYSMKSRVYQVRGATV
jgi:hypothetical protein